MKSTAIILLLLMAAVPAIAQTRFEVGAHYAFVDPLGSTDFDDEIEFDLESGEGYGISAGYRVTPQFSIEATASRLEIDSQLDFGGDGEIPLGALELTALTATARLHLFSDRFIDPYVGAGAAWVDASELDDEEILGELGLREIEFKSGATWVAEAGVRVALGRSVSLSVGGKYIAFEPDSTAIFVDDPVPSEAAKIEINPLVVTAGIHFRF